MTPYNPSSVEVLRGIFSQRYAIKFPFTRDQPKPAALGPSITSLLLSASFSSSSTAPSSNPQTAVMSLSIDNVPELSSSSTLSFAEKRRLIEERTKAWLDARRAAQESAENGTDEPPKKKKRRTSAKKDD
jgi:hypothetical protein